VILTLNFGPHVTDVQRFSLPILDFYKGYFILLQALNPIYFSEDSDTAFKVLLIFELERRGWSWSFKDRIRAAHSHTWDAASWLNPAYET
jgi:hypothetical protein